MEGRFGVLIQELEKPITLVMAMCTYVLNYLKYI